MEHTDQAEIRVGPKGRVVIPAAMRKALGVKPGTLLVVRREGSSIILESRAHVLERLQARYEHLPAGMSLADELIAERRAEAAQDTHE